MTINKKELKYIIWAGVFAFVWFVYLLPMLINKFDGQDPVFQFIVFNLGLYAFFFIFLKSITTNNSVNLKTSFGLTALYVSLDILLPEYHVSTAGELIKGAALGVSTPDYFFGVIGQSMGIFGFLLYLFVYLAVPMILFFIAAKTLGNFVRNI